MRKQNSHGILSHRTLAYVLPIILGVNLAGPLLGQSELMAWGNLTGIRVEGQLMEFESSLQVVGKGWTNLNSTGMEKQQPKYHREGQKQTVTTKIGAIRFTEVFEDRDNGITGIAITTVPETDTLPEGVFFCLDLSGKYYANGSARFLNGSPAGKSKFLFSDFDPGNNSKPFKINAKGVIIESPLRQLEINITSNTPVYIRKETESNGIQIYFSLARTEKQKGIGNQENL